MGSSWDLGSPRQPREISRHLSLDQENLRPNFSWTFPCEILDKISKNIFSKNGHRDDTRARYQVHWVTWTPAPTNNFLGGRDATLQDAISRQPKMVEIHMNMILKGKILLFPMHIRATL